MKLTMTSTPNPNALKFTAEESLFSKRIEVFKTNQTNSPILTKLIAINGVISLFGFNNFITVCKSPEASWDDLLPQINAALKEL
ncbi:NifU N-terminal domain-containing protein [Sporolactobacillus shoreicorticis]|uniref:NifU N-terminal domain-containing protein n=1 Tax=Sporolactobacillus shoreicorticis TaxID=1923877 RepID=A0ABW5S737_9BACL|nr:NifU N-terminal domain-containing protein [Sporolactobacillus shoreicorticis]MCO7126685.1 NifU N-terminal domain-containing protein [Sporolactobacillus shoreicorticis]